MDVELGRRALAVGCRALVGGVALLLAACGGSNSLDEPLAEYQGHNFCALVADFHSKSETLKRDVDAENGDAVDDGVRYLYQVARAAPTEHQNDWQTYAAYMDFATKIFRGDMDAAYEVPVDFEAGIDSRDRVEATLVVCGLTPSPRAT